MKRLLSSLFIASAMMLTAQADEVLFKSGDRLTGTVKTIDGGVMTFASKVAGTVSLKIADIDTFSTDQPINIVMKSGEKKSIAVTGAQKPGFVTSVADTKSMIALAEITKVNPPPVKWTGNVTAGATLVRGNTESDTAALTFEASRRSEKDRISFAGQYLFAQQHNFTTKEDDTTTDNWFIKGQYDYFFTKKNYIYGNLKYEKDRIQELDKRFTPGLGWGYQWIERADLNLKTEVGGSWIYERYEEPDETRTYQAARFAYSMDKQFHKVLKAYHNLEYIPSLERVDTYLINADVGLQADLTASWALNMKVQFAYNSQPADEKDNLDTRYILGVTWKF